MVQVVGCGGLGLFLVCFWAWGSFLLFFNAFRTVSWFLSLKGVHFLVDYLSVSDAPSSTSESLVCV